MDGSPSSPASLVDAARIDELEAKVAALDEDLRRLRNGFRIAGAVALEAGDLPCLHGEERSALEGSAGR